MFDVASETAIGATDAGSVDARDLRPPGWLFVLVLAAGLVGVVAGRRLRGRRVQSAVVRLGVGSHPLPRELGGGGGLRQVAVRAAVGQEVHALTLSVIDVLARQGQVLLAPAGEAVRVGTMGPGAIGPVWVSEWRRPPARRVLRDADRIASSGPPLSLVVEGSAALESCHPSAPTAALGELLAASRYPVVVVLSSREPCPDGLTPSSWTPQLECS